MEEKFLYIDTTDKIMGIPVKHLATGAFGAILASNFTGQASSPFALLIIPIVGYIAYRISFQLEKAFPSTSFRYYTKWLSGAQVYYPGRDVIAAPLVIPSDEV